MNEQNAEVEHGSANRCLMSGDFDGVAADRSEVIASGMAYGFWLRNGFDRLAQLHGTGLPRWLQADNCFLRELQRAKIFMDVVDIVNYWTLQEWGLLLAFDAAPTEVIMFLDLGFTGEITGHWAKKIIRVAMQGNPPSSENLVDD